MDGSAVTRRWLTAARAGGASDRCAGIIRGVTPSRSTVLICERGVYPASRGGRAGARVGGRARYGRAAERAARHDAADDGTMIWGDGRAADLSAVWRRAERHQGGGRSAAPEGASLGAREEAEEEEAEQRDGRQRAAHADARGPAAAARRDRDAVSRRLRLAPRDAHRNALRGARGRSRARRTPHQPKKTPPQSGAHLKRHHHNPARI